LPAALNQILKQKIDRGKTGELLVFFKSNLMSLEWWICRSISLANKYL